MSNIDGKDAETLIMVLATSLRRMSKLHNAMMREANHKHTAWSADTIQQMNNAPRIADNALALFELYGFKLPDFANQCRQLDRYHMQCELQHGHTGAHFINGKQKTECEL